MSRSILLAVTHPDASPGRVAGFRWLWAWYVDGYHPDRHCQACFKGRPVENFDSLAVVGGAPAELVLSDRFEYVYVCGVGPGPRHELRWQNFHFPLKYTEGSVEEATTYNGYTFRVENASVLPIPELPAGWKGKDEAHVRCKNFQFAVEYFGKPRAVSRTSTVEGAMLSAPDTVVHSDPEILSGTPVFVGTRVPFQSLIDYLAGGDSLDEFLRQFPSVRREQAQAALGLAREALEARLSVA
jgi:uncharacterized protein (DUF433 family)